MRHANQAALGLLVACSCGREPMRGTRGALRPSSASVVAPAGPAKPAQAPLPQAKLADAPGPPLRVAYRGCLGAVRVADVAGETYALYGFDEVGRIDRLGDDGAPVQTYDLPVGADKLRYADEKGPGPEAKVPISEMVGLGGSGPADLYAIVELNYAMENWESFVFALKGGSWVNTEATLSQLYPRGARGVLGFTASEFDREIPYFEVIAGPGKAPRLYAIVEHAAAAGAGPGALDDLCGSAGIEVLDYAVAQHGLVLALVRYDPTDCDEGAGEPVGSWLMVWGSAGEALAMERIADTYEIGDAVVYAHRDAGYIQFGGALHRWHDGDLKPLALPSRRCGEERDPPWLQGVDPSGQLWLACDGELAHGDGLRWTFEPLPGPPEVLRGVAQGALWTLTEDKTLWSRGEDGTWTNVPYTLEAPARDDLGPPYEPSITVDQRGDLWMTQEFLHSGEATGAGQTQQTTYVYTSRPLPQPNPCRGVEAPAAAPPG